EVLQVARVGLDDHFFMLGGHSLTAMQAIILIHERLLINFTLVDFFAHPVLAEMANLLELAADAASQAEAQDLLDMDVLLQALEN
ncbi:non-ribosomal peptide synthase, partial [Legionella cincinnatiensis]